MTKKQAILIPTQQELIDKRTLRLFNTCIYFTGIFYKICEAKVEYDKVLIKKHDPAFGATWIMPCMRDDNHRTCSLATFRTLEQAKADAVAKQEAINESLKRLSEDVCPICKVKVKKEQRGVCVYGSCGHRLYQGRI